LDRGKKEVVVKELHEKLAEAQLVVRMGFTGLKVEETNDLRRQIEKVGGITLAVIKNSLAEIASRETATAPLFAKLNGPNGFLISSKDLVAPAKILVEFAKKRDKLVLKEAILTGKLINVAQIKALADMPSREALLGRVLYVMNAPIQNFVQVLAAVPRSLLNVLNAVKEEKAKAAA
jgi:large subunit ribosomal protein L10